MGRFHQPLGAIKASANSLLTNLNSYWVLNETSGTRADSVGGMTLTDNNSVLSSTGHVSTPAALFASVSSQYLSHTANAILNTGDIDFTVAAWVYFTTVGVHRPIVQKGWDDAYGEYILYYNDGTAKPKFEMANGAANVENSSAAVMSILTWYFVVAGYDAAADQLFVSTNAGTQDTASYSGGNTTVTGNFKIGAGVGQFQNGMIQEVGFWKRRLSLAEITTLYNANAGKTYPF